MKTFKDTEGTCKSLTKPWGSTGTATVVQELRGRGLSAVGYFKEPVQGDTETQDYFQ